MARVPVFFPDGRPYGQPKDLVFDGSVVVGISDFQYSEHTQVVQHALYRADFLSVPAAGGLYAGGIDIDLFAFLLGYDGDIGARGAEGTGAAAGDTVAAISGLAGAYGADGAIES